MGTRLKDWGHIYSTARNSEELEINLFPGELLSVSMRIGGEIICRAGRLWITQEGDSRDYVLTAGDRFQASSHGLTLIESLPESDRLIQEALAQETRSGRSRIQSLRRLLRVIASRQLAPRAPTLADADSRMPSGKLEQLEQACGQAKG